MKKNSAFLIVLGILFISFNLRAPITAVGSVVSMIQSDYGISTTVAGFITTIPLLAFAVVSPFVSKVAGRTGLSQTMMGGLVLILLGVIIRSYTGTAGLFIGTAVIGIGIAIGNVIIPSIIKKSFPEKVGAITSVYTSGMCIFASVGAGVSVPVASGLGWGWKNSLAIWIALTAVTILIWLPQVRNRETAGGAYSKSSAKRSSIWSSKLAWMVTIFMGIQSLLFYSLTAWLPTIVSSKGMSGTFAGNMALLFQLMAIPATLIVPALCDRFRNQRGLVAVSSIFYAAGILLFLFAGSKALICVAVVIMSLCMGANISLAIAFISLRSPDASRAAELSGMSQSAGYLIAAFGPTVTGLIFDLNASWTVPLLLFVALVACLFISGMFAGSNETVRD